MMWRKELTRVDIQKIIRDHYPSEISKKVVGLMKDTLGEFVALGAKMYAYRR